MGGSDNLVYKTIGEIVRNKRKEAGIQLPQLAEKIGISKATLSDIENQKTKRPEMKTVKAIVLVLDIPYMEILESYIEVENRLEPLRELLHEAIAVCNLPMVEKVAVKFLQSPKQDTYTALDYIYDLARSDFERDCKLTLYEVIRKYTRERGVQDYFARSSFQKYLIERDDFTRLQETYNSGKAILDYIGFLAHDERVLMHYKLGVHAYNLQLFDDCIDLCEYVVQKGTTMSEMKARATFAVCNSYYYLGKYKLARKYLEYYKNFPFPEVALNAKLVSGGIKANLGNYDQGIEELRQCLAESDDHVLIHVAVQLMAAYLRLGKLDSMKELIELEPKLAQPKMTTPFKKAEVANYYKLKGDYLVRNGEIGAGIQCYLTSALHYGKVSGHLKVYECLSLIMPLYVEHQKSVDIQLFREVGNIYHLLSDTSFRQS